MPGRTPEPRQFITFERACYAAAKKAREMGRPQVVARGTNASGAGRQWFFVRGSWPTPAGWSYTDVATIAAPEATP